MAEFGFCCEAESDLTDGAEKMKESNNKEKDLKHLSRGELLELLLEQTRRANSLEKRVEELEEQLRNRAIIIEEAGSLAEAALQINQVFSAADAAARQYVANVRLMADSENKQNEVR